MDHHAEAGKEMARRDFCAKRKNRAIYGRKNAYL
jgi:hypothetical protein